MITRRSALRALAGFTAAPGILRARRTPGDKPNLLFLWTYQQRADFMAAYGNTRYRVPIWNKLASECVVFDRCYDAQPAALLFRPAEDSDRSLWRNFPTYPDLQW